MIYLFSQIIWLPLHFKIEVAPAFVSWGKEGPGLPPHSFLELVKKKTRKCSLVNTLYTILNNYECCILDTRTRTSRVWQVLI